MSTRRDYLDLITEMLLRGVLPRNSKVRTLDYSQVKLTLKGKTKIKFTANEVSKLLSFVVVNISNALLRNNELEYLTEQEACHILFKNWGNIQPEITKIAGKTLSPEDSQEIISIMVVSMSIFDGRTNLRRVLLRTQAAWNEKEYIARKVALDSLFERELSKNEFHLVATTWSHYASLAADLIHPDNFYKEQIKEIKKILSQKIKYINAKIKSQKDLIDKLKMMDRKVFIDIPKEKQILLSEISQLKETEAIQIKFRQDNGSESNVHSIQKHAYFALFFLGELMGLKKPNTTNRKNYYLNLIDILTGWSVYGFEENATRKRISKIYGKYNKFKKNEKIRQLMDKLINLSVRNIEPHELIQQFTSNILPLSIHPKI